MIAETLLSLLDGVRRTLDVPGPIDERQHHLEDRRVAQIPVNLQRLHHLLERRVLVRQRHEHPVPILDEQRSERRVWRDPATQACPAFDRMPLATAFAVRAMSASAKTSCGLLPPSSSVIGLMPVRARINPSVTISTKTSVETAVKRNV